MQWLTWAYAVSNVAFFKCDVTEPSSIGEASRQLRLKWGDPSILINNAGIGKPAPLIDTPNEFVTKIFQINIISHFCESKPLKCLKPY